MSATALRVDDGLTVLRQYFTEPDNAVKIRRAISTGIAAAESEMLSDTEWRVPRNYELRQSEFERWLAPFRELIINKVGDEMAREFPNLLSAENARFAAELAIGQAEPDLQQRYSRVLEQQLQFAVRGIALPWVSDNLGDTLLLSLPFRDEQAQVWRVPLALDKSSPPRTYVVVSKNGDILSDSESLLRELSRA